MLISPMHFNQFLKSWECIYFCIHLFLYLRFVGRIRASEYDLKGLVLFLGWVIRPVEVFSDGEQVIFESHRRLRIRN